MSPPTTKPIFRVGLDASDDCPLIGHRTLALTDASAFYHLSRGMRSPLGIYNASIARLCPRIQKYCGLIEPLFREQKVNPEREGVSREIVAESLESMIYAAAEHVDDLENLASGFFKTLPLAKRDERYKTFTNRISRLKKTPSTIANKLKHEQARIRLYAMEIRHGDIPASLHGFVVEGVNNGVIGPHRAIHPKHSVLSLTTIAWDILEFVAGSSRALAHFLETFPKHPTGAVPSSCETFTGAVKAAARLPTYTFGEEHPFSRTTFVLLGSEATQLELDSGLYGSIHRRWTDSPSMGFGSFAMTTEGDGVSKSFQLVSPTNVSLVRWS